jgi:hypothetical protein
MQIPDTMLGVKEEGFTRAAYLHNDGAKFN